MAPVLNVILCTVYSTKRQCNQAADKNKSSKKQRNSDYYWNSLKPIVQSNIWSFDSHHKLFREMLGPYSEGELLKRPQWYVKQISSNVERFGNIYLWMHMPRNRHIYHSRRPRCCMKWHFIFAFYHPKYYHVESVMSSILWLYLQQFPFYIRTIYDIQWHVTVMCLFHSKAKNQIERLESQELYLAIKLSIFGISVQGSAYVVQPYRKNKRKS